MKLNSILVVVLVLCFLSCKNDKVKKQDTTSKQSITKTVVNRKDIVTEHKKCIITTVSEKFLFEIEASEFQNEKENKYPISAWITIRDKKSKKKKQEIRFEPNSWFGIATLPCNKFVVKDFNFDGLDDFAFIWDVGGSSGELYEYYVQDENGTFNLDEKLPIQDGPLPFKIDNKSKTLIIKSSVGCCKENITNYNLSEGKWVLQKTETKAISE